MFLCVVFQVQFVLQKDERFCKKFHLNGTTNGNCEGIYEHNNRFCAQYPIYKMISGSANRFAHRYYDGRWRCSPGGPVTSCSIGSYFGTLEDRDNIEGYWKESSWATCLD